MPLGNTEVIRELRDGSVGHGITGFGGKAKRPLGNVLSACADVLGQEVEIGLAQETTSVEHGVLEPVGSSAGSAALPTHLDDRLPEPVEGQTDCRLEE